MHGCAGRARGLLGDYAVEGSEMHSRSLSVQTEEKKWKWVQRQNHTEYQIVWITLFETLTTMMSHPGSYVLDPLIYSVVQRGIS